MKKRVVSIDLDANQGEKFPSDASTEIKFLASAFGGGGGSTDPEIVRDTIAAALRGINGVVVSSDDAGDTITVSIGSVAQSSVTGLSATLTSIAAALDGKASVSHTHTKADVGLPNVDNTSDNSKPVSAAQQVALDARVQIGGDLSGATTSPVVFKSVSIPGVAAARISRHFVGNGIPTGDIPGAAVGDTYRNLATGITYDITGV